MSKFTDWSNRREIIYKVHLHRLPVIASASFGMLVGILLVFMLYVQREDRLVQAFVDDYGSSMAVMAANGAIDATLNHDLVSMQVILQDVARNPRVLLATIHDVENNLLVQAGEAAALERVASVKQYTAPVPLLDSVAGYVSVSVDASLPESYLPYGVLGLSILLLGVALLSMHDGEGRVLERVPSQPSARENRREVDTVNFDDIALTDETMNNTGSEIDAAVVDMAAEPVAVSQVHIRLSNYAKLQQQISSSLFDSAVHQFREYVTAVSVLYEGHIGLVESLCGEGSEVEGPEPDEGGLPEEILLTIPDYNSADDAFYKALCAAKLIASFKPGQNFCLGVQAYASLAGRSGELPSLADARSVYFDLASAPEQLAASVSHEPMPLDTSVEGVEAAASQAKLLALLGPYAEVVERQTAILSQKFSA